MNIQPFRGYRYAVGGTPDISPVVAPPYDQISPEMQERLLAMSAHNVVRVTLPQDELGLDRYQRARQVLQAWLAAGVWTPEPRPAIYPYHQTYAAQGRRITREGFVALGEVSDYAQGIVRPHERTHAGPKRDRLRLLEATGADMGLLFMLTSDPDGALREAVRPAGEPVAEGHDLRGELHQLWRITDEATIARVQALMIPRSVIIADGHHRYETAVEYARDHPGCRLKLMTFCTLEAPGLTILANHRLVHGVEGFALDGLAERARPWFETAPLVDPLRFTPTTRSIGAVSGARALVFRLRDEAVAKVPWPAHTSPAWRALSVSILHEGLLKPLLDITEAKLDARSHVDYTADTAEAVRLAREGGCQAAFLIAPTTADELRAVVEGGELLPQKSTHFYPKLLDGLVFHRLQEA
ncbi:MAG TPA: DUF1015 domain-containing protein [Methylomirabilota bacterium]|nr:DUF1015 domain-containing protein [Methylomirabilota bacterium]